MRLERRVASLAEPAIRRAVALEWLESLDAETGYARLSEVLERPEVERPNYPTLRDALHHALVECGALRELPYALRCELYAQARARGDDFVMRLLRSADLAARMEDPAASLPKPLAELPLGVRRSIARGRDHGLLERLLLDPDPIVIGHLLANPRITEDDVLRIASRRPIPAETLQSIHRSRRFGARPRVRLALCRNPYCPTDVALSLLGRIPLAELRAIALDATLHVELRLQAEAEIRRRSPDAASPER
jgi:hypothetical protein